MEASPMIFVFGVDEAFAMPTGVAIRSLDRFLGDRDRIALLTVDLRPETASRLQVCATNVAVELHPCEHLLAPEWVPPAHVTRAAYARYLAADLLGDAPRCVYFDGDVVVRADPRPLHDADLRGCTLGAVRSRVTPFVASPGGIARWLDAGLRGADPYFNSGVLVMDLQRWRQRDVNARITDYLRRFAADAQLNDQEAVNVAVSGDWVTLDRTWNYVTHVADAFLQEPSSEPTDPAVVHFAGRDKPWLHGPMPMYADEWYELLAATPWASYRPVAPPPPSRARRIVGTATRRMVDGVRRVARP